MAESRKHRQTAEKIARKKGVEYNPGKGPDIIGPGFAIEVEDADTMPDAMRQLQGYRRRVYIAGVDRQAVEAALVAAEGTTVGVTDSQGNIIKSSSRKTS